MSKPKRHHVGFDAEQRVSKPARVKFTTEDGTKVSFPAHKKVKQKVHVDFMAKNRKK